jgi:mannose-6-phosphate isomerase-like protein (cupin superfamily)
MNNNDFITPSNHVNFLAKKLFENCGEIINGSIAYLEPNGGGPTELHTHEHDHLFIVVKGEAKVLFEDKTQIIKENDSFIVNGNMPHSVWNNISNTTIMIGITIKGKRNV